MKIPKKCKLNRAAGKPNESRFSMENVLLDVDAKGRGRLIATNGRVLAVVPVDEVGDDTGGMVPATAIAEAVKGSGEFVNVEANGCVRYPVKGGTMEVERPSESDSGEFPKWKQVVPKGEVVHRLALNPQLLLDVAAAIGSGESVVLEYREEGGPLVVRPGKSLHDAEPTMDDWERFGVLMPITTKVAVPEDAPMTAGQKAAATRKRNAEAKAAAEQAGETVEEEAARETGAE